MHYVLLKQVGSPSRIHIMRTLMAVSRAQLVEVIASMIPLATFLALGDFALGKHEKKNRGSAKADGEGAEREREVVVPCRAKVIPTPFGY